MIYYSKRKMAVYKLVLCRKKALLRSPIVQKKPIVSSLMCREILNSDPQQTQPDVRQLPL